MGRKQTALALACAGALAIVPAGLAMSQSEPEQPALGPEQPQEVPALTDAEVAAAAAVAAQDPGLARVIGVPTGVSAAAARRVTPGAIARAMTGGAGARASAVGLTLQDIGVWSDDAGRVVGVELTVGLPGPMTITADWPTLSDPDSGWSGPTAHYTARNVRALTIDIDLVQRRVVNVEPDGNADVDAPEGTELPAPADGEGA